MGSRRHHRFRWNRLLAVPAALVVAVASPAIAQGAAGDWPQLGYGPAHNGYQRDDTVLSRSSVPHLVRAFRAPTSGYVGGPVAVGGTLYMPLLAYSANQPYSYLLALSGQTGATLWRSPLDHDGLDFSPAVAAGVVYVTTLREESRLGGSLYAINAQTGQHLWRVAGTAQTSPVVADGLVFVGSGEYGGPYSLVAYDATTGAVRWRAPVGLVNAAAAPAVANGRVFIATQGTVYAFDEHTGVLLWQRVVPGEPGKTPVIASGLLLVGGYQGLWALNTTTGVSAWSFRSGPVLHFVQGRAAVANGAVYVDIDNHLVALTLSNGAFRWQRTLVPEPTAAVEASPAYANGVIFVPGWINSKNGLLAFGKRGRYLRGILTQGGDPIVSNGRVYLGNFQYVDAYAASSPLTSSNPPAKSGTVEPTRARQPTG